MRICCDLCGGVLQMNAGGQYATCMTCGMTHTLDRLRRMLREAQTPVTPVTPLTPVDTPAQPNLYAAPQFVMNVSSIRGGAIIGTVQQGGIGVGDTVFINNDFSHPYQALGNDDTEPVKRGDTMQELLSNVPPHILRQARIITGVPNPVKSFYNYYGDIDAYFRHILEQYFGEYQIQYKVPCNGVSVPIDYVLNKDGRPVVGIFLMGERDEKWRYAARKAARVLEPYGIGVTHFFWNYRNDAPYVVERIRSAMK